MENQFLSDVVVIEDFLPSYYQDMIEEIAHFHTPFMFGNSLQGTSVLGNSYLKKKGYDGKVYEQFQLAHNVMFRNMEDFGANTDDMKFQFYNRLDWGHYFLTPLQMGLASIGLKTSYENIFRTKINLQTQAPDIARGKYNLPHIDIADSIPEPHKALIAIYYVTNSDGDTYFFNEDDISDLNKLTIKRKISPKKGTLAIFPAHWLHAGSHPVDSSYRIAINYNFYATSLDNMAEKRIKDLEQVYSME